MSPKETEEAILQGLQAYGIEPEIYYTTLEDTGKGLASRAAAEHGRERVAGAHAYQHARCAQAHGRDVQHSLVRDWRRRRSSDRRGTQSDPEAVHRGASR